MTSEIAVMNQRAVALAADSAVTLVDGVTVAVRNDQRKLFQLVEGLRYAFPKAARRHLKKAPRVLALHGAVAQQRRVAAYLASPRRLPFSEAGIFRHYPELDG